MEEYDHNPPKIDTRKIKSRKKKKKKIHIATYNSTSLSSYERLLELEEAIQVTKYDVGISETRRLGTNIQEMEEAFTQPGDPATNQT